FKSTDYSSQLGTLTVVRNSDTTGSGTGGLVTWTFTANDGALAQLAAGQTVHEVYNVTLNDQHGGVITQDVIITINGVNDAPVLAPSNPGLTTITEDQSNNPGQTVASFADPSISDVDNGAVKGIAVTGLTSANGTWQYSINGGSTWSNIGAVSNGSALLLADTDLIRFVPNGHNGSSDTITYRAWDQTSGSHGTTADTTVNGGTTAFSTATDTAHLTVIAVDIAPVVDLNEDTSGFNNAVSYPKPVSPIHITHEPAITDPDSATLVSMAITLTNPQDNSTGPGGAGVNIKEILSLDAAAAALAAADGLTVTFTSNVAHLTDPVTLTITGSASVADYQAILAGVQYADTKGGNHNNTDRIVSVVVNDGTLDSVPRTVTIHVAAPAGVAGEPINLALADPSADH